MTPIDSGREVHSARGASVTQLHRVARRSPTWINPSSSGGNCDMSHHLDTPLAPQNGQLYIDDLCVFSGDRSTVLIMDVNSTVTGPDVQRGFHPQARHEFKVHFDGADFEALTYRVSFGEGDSDGRQALQLHAFTGLGIVDAAVKNGTAVDLSAWRPEAARNSCADTTVKSIVLEVSHQHPQLHPGARIGAWHATRLATNAGGWRQINRAGHPMMWPIFWPDDTDFS